MLGCRGYADSLFSIEFLSFQHWLRSFHFRKSNIFYSSSKIWFFVEVFFSFTIFLLISALFSLACSTSLSAAHAVPHSVLEWSFLRINVLLCTGRWLDDWLQGPLYSLLTDGIIWNACQFYYRGFRYSAMIYRDSANAPHIMIDVSASLNAWFTAPAKFRQKLLVDDILASLCTSRLCSFFSSISLS